MKKAVLTLALLFLALVAYLGLWPVPIQPVAWNAPAAPGYSGVHAANNKLAGLQLISLGAEEGPEHVVLARDGKLYAAVASGNILRMNADGTGQEVFASTGGRGGMDGKIWLGFSGPRSADVDAMAGKPFLRKLTLRLPRVLWPLPKAYGHVIAFTEDGRVVADLQDPTGVYPQTTGLTETVDRLYVQNLHLRVLGWRAR
jgi:hypothetical protein